MPRQRARGYTFVWVLLVIAVLGIGAAKTAEVWTTIAQRDREAQLLFVGEQYRRAIQSYYDQTPGAVKQLPVSLEQLLRDARFPGNVRHLRRLYADPVTRTMDWGLVRFGDGIAGVHSRSSERPFRRGGFAARYATFANASRYSDWQFGITLQGEGAAAGTTGASPQPSPGVSTPNADPFVPLVPATPTAPSPSPSSKPPSASPDRVQECQRQQLAAIEACRQIHARERKELLACIARATAQSAACRNAG